jgi:hypothetical protein
MTETITSKYFEKKKNQHTQTAEVQMGVPRAIRIHIDDHRIIEIKDPKKLCDVHAKAALGESNFSVGRTACDIVCLVPARIYAYACFNNYS